MRTMAEMATGLAAAITGCRVRMALVLVGFFVGAATAHAQDVSVEFAEGTLAPAAEEMAAAGVDGSLERAATLIEIAQRYGFGYGISPDEVRDLLGVGYQAIRQIDCSSLDARAEAAQRLSRALATIAWLYAAGAGLTFSAPPVAAALGFGALATGILSSAAGWLAADYRAQRSQVKCSKDGGVEWFRPAARRILAAADLTVLPFSWRRSYGASPSA
jgi:hypothetical protein